jgi:hypothetical protein
MIDDANLPPLPSPSLTPPPSTLSPLASSLSDAPDLTVPKQPPTVLQCLNGSIVAAVLAWGASGLTQKVSTNFAAHPLASANYVAVNISVAVRTLVVGMFALATGVFALAALGLLGLGIQTLIQKRAGDRPAG